MVYSKKVTDLLKAQEIGVGDRIRVEKGEQVFEGVLLPKPEASGDENALVMKQDSGYNVGIEYTPTTKIKKLKGKTRLEHFPLLEVKHKRGLPSISLINTGGTVSSRVDYRTGGVHGLMKAGEILATAPRLQEIVNIRNVLNPFRLMSEDFTYKEWQEIALLTAKELNEGSDGVVITQGTDTMHFTSAALSFMLPNLSKPVAIVGAQRSPDRGSFDGTINLLCAATYAASDIAGVAIVMHATSSDDYCFAHSGTKVRKMHSTRRDAFQSINVQPIAKIWPDGRIEVLRKDVAKRSNAKAKVEADTEFDSRIALVKAYPGSDPKEIDFFVGKGVRGIVIEGTALGHVPTSPLDASKSWIPAIKKAIDAGIVVVMTSQCLYGEVHPNVYANLRKVSGLGVIYCKDILPETAYVKLGWCLAHSKDPTEVKKRMLENIAGEFNPRLTEKDFLF